MQYKVTVSFVNEDGANFHKLFETMRYMGLKICMGDKTHRHYKKTSSFVKIQEVTLMLAED